MDRYLDLLEVDATTPKELRGIHPEPHPAAAGQAQQAGERDPATPSTPSCGPAAITATVARMCRAPHRRPPRLQREAPSPRVPSPCRVLHPADPLLPQRRVETSDALAVDRRHPLSQGGITPRNEAQPGTADLRPGRRDPHRRVSPIYLGCAAVARHDHGRHAAASSGRYAGTSSISTRPCS